MGAILPVIIIPAIYQSATIALKPLRRLRAEWTPYCGSSPSSAPEPRWCCWACCRAGCLRRVAPSRGPPPYRADCWPPMRASRPWVPGAPLASTDAACVLMCSRCENVCSTCEHVGSTWNACVQTDQCGCLVSCTRVRPYRWSVQPTCAPPQLLIVQRRHMSDHTYSSCPASAASLLCGATMSAL